MKLLRDNALGLLFSAIAVGFVAAVYDHLPDPFPTHWNARGEIDGWTHKPWGPFLLPLTVVAIAVIFAVLSRSRHVARFERAFRVMSAAVTGAMLALTIAMTSAAMGHGVDVRVVVPVVLGAMFAVMGNLFGKLTRNPWIGIRTPWTLASDEVWLRTHRFGGKVFVLSGLAAIVFALVGWGFEALVASALFASISSVVYSYFAAKRV
jgi:uncharacterized membrane protein